jgi:hypothetical protein
MRVEGLHRRPAPTSRPAHGPRHPTLGGAVTKHATSLRRLAALLGLACCELALRVLGKVTDRHGDEEQ